MHSLWTIHTTNLCLEGASRKRMRALWYLPGHGSSLWPGLVLLASCRVCQLAFLLEVSSYCLLQEEVGKIGGSAEPREEGDCVSCPGIGIQLRFQLLVCDLSRLQSRMGGLALWTAPFWWGLVAPWLCASDSAVLFPSHLSSAAVTRRGLTSWALEVPLGSMKWCLTLWGASQVGAPDTNPDFHALLMLS